ncbi:MAG TPA: ATP-binding cassette domain-containing protein, partial [Myxococcaceae bacterium]
MIRIRNLEKAVRSGTGSLFLLRNINLAVEKGDFLTLMGPSGAGKSTLLAVMGMLDADWTGEFELDGQRVDRMSAKDRQALARRHVGFVFQ